MYSLGNMPVSLQVYPMEKITAEGNVWHKTCFRCTADGCAKMLSLGNFAAMGGQVGCATMNKNEGVTCRAGSGA